MAYLPLSTANLPDPVIDPAQGASPEDYFNTVLYTGNGSTQSITGVGHQPDWVWIKERSSTSSHSLSDVVRGAGAHILASDTTDAEDTSNANVFTSFDSDGFSVGTNNRTNQSSQTYVAWNWKANGSGVSNTDGSIPSTVSANTTSGFSIVSYTGNDTDGATVGHGLNQTLDFCIVKSRDVARNWPVKHSALTGENSVFLNTTSASGVTGAGNVTFDETDTFTLNDGSASRLNINKNNEDYIAYCFHSVDGFSKVGSYTGNGSTDGTFVYTGFRPSWIMVKQSSASGEHWEMWDDKRSTYNINTPLIYANLINAEGGNSSRYDVLSNGFKLRTTNAGANASATYIYMAFAENPFKYSNAR